MKTNYGSVSNNEHTIEKNIDVDTVPVSLKDAIIGGGLALLGVAYIAITSFKNGSKAYGIAETEALRDIGCIDKEDADAIIDGFKNTKF